MTGYSVATALAFAALVVALGVRAVTAPPIPMPPAAEAPEQREAGYGLPPGDWIRTTADGCTERCSVDVQHETAERCTITCPK